MPQPKSTRAKAETLRQAQEWDRRRDYFARSGLCNLCAARSAWGEDPGVCESPMCKNSKDNYTT